MRVLPKKLVKEVEQENNNIELVVKEVEKKITI